MKNKVILLPTDKVEIGKFIKSSQHSVLMWIMNQEDLNYIKNHNNTHTVFDLYILSDEEIKDGDWVIAEYPDGKYLVQVTEIYLGNVEHGKQLMFSGGGFTHEIRFCKKIISSTDKSLGLPTPDDESLKLYCDNPSEYVEVEHELIHVHSAFPKQLEIKISSNNTISLKPVVEGESWDDIINSLPYPLSIERRCALWEWLKDNYNPPIKKN